MTPPLISMSRCCEKAVPLGKATCPDCEEASAGYQGAMGPGRPTYTAPNPPRGEHETTVYPDWANGEPVVCHFEYLEGEPGDWDHPDVPDEFNLISAYIRGWDCYRVLSRKQVEEIEIQISRKVGSLKEMT